jgi:hypothetical protein
VTNYFKVTKPNGSAVFFFFEDTSRQDVEYKFARARGPGILGGKAEYDGVISVWRRSALVHPLIPEVGECCPFQALKVLCVSGPCGRQAT